VDREAPRLPGLDAEFKTVRELGRGGSAVVYLAIEHELDRPVAIKVIHPALAVDEETVQRLMREARTLARLSHPNIVTLYGIRRLEDGRLALIMQYAGAQTLRDWLRDAGPANFATVHVLLRDIAEALAHAHQYRIVHRDIKPENIYLDTTTGSARLSDFGIARIWDHDAGLTLGGVAIGTPTYMSPEQVDGNEVDGRSDLYSLGLIGWELLAGRKPWEGESLYGVIYKQKHDLLPPLAALRPGIPEPLRAAIETALAKRPEQRWPDAESFLRQLDELGRASLHGPGTRGPAPGSPAGAVAPVPPVRPAKVAEPPSVALPLTPLAEEGTTGDLPTIRFRRALADAGALPSAQPRRPPQAAVTRRRRSRGRLVVTVLGSVALAGSLGAAAMAYRRTPAPAEADPATAASQATPEPGPQVASAPPVANPSAAQVENRGAAPTEHPGARPVEDLSGDLQGSSASAQFEGEVASATPVRLMVITGGRLRGLPLATLSETMTIRAEDAAGHPVAGAVVEFRVVEGGGSIRGRSLETDARGMIEATWTLGPAAELNVAIATIAGLPGVQARLEAETLRPELVPRPALAVGGTHTCALRGSGRLFCWGANNRGQTGTGGGWPLSPLPVSSSAALVSVAAGASHTCALTSAGSAVCWGANEKGQLGDGLREARLVPAAVAGKIGYTSMAAGLAHTCALTSHGAAYCWGGNERGQLGDGTLDDRVAPTAVAAPSTFRSIATGWAHTCAITHAEIIYCWGANESGQLGDGTTADRPAPSAGVGEYRVRMLTAGSAHTCAITTGGALYCWGRNSDGQLGTGDQVDRHSPTLVALDLPLVQVSAGGVHTCGLTAAGSAYCWGRNLYGQLGDGTMTDRVFPAPVADTLRFAMIQANGAHTCATARSGGTYCWGYNADGQLGDGTRTNRSRPVAVQPTSR
jgi:alpha-tubulin suppressor-like RCC1 family protein